MPNPPLSAALFSTPDPAATFAPLNARLSAAALNGQQILNGNLNMQLFAQFAEVRQKRVRAKTLPQTFLLRTLITKPFATFVHFDSLVFGCRQSWIFGHFD